MSEFPPLSIQFSGRPRERFETHAMDLQPSIVRASPRLRVHSRAEAQRLPSYLQAQDRSVFDAQMIPTLYRVQEDRCEALAERGYTVADGTVQIQELLADSGVPTCESGGETVRALARSQTGSPVTCPTPTPSSLPKSGASTRGSRPRTDCRPPAERVRSNLNETIELSEPHHR